MYKEVCATCHSLEGIRFGQLVDVILLEEEAKADAAEAEVGISSFLFSPFGRIFCRLIVPSLRITDL